MTQVSDRPAGLTGAEQTERIRRLARLRTARIRVHKIAAGVPRLTPDELIELAEILRSAAGRENAA